MSLQFRKIKPLVSALGYTACILLLVCLAKGQFRFDSWTTEDGLPQNSVNSIVQTADGYLWFTTLDGLVRFDGVKFKVFSKGNSPNLITNRLRKLLADGDTIWMTTEDGGLIRRRNDEFKTFTAAGLSVGGVNEIQKDADGSLLFFGNSGVVRTRDGGASFALERKQNLAEYHVYIAPESGTRWEINRDGLSATSGGRTIRYRLPFEPKPLKFNTAFDFYSQIKFFEDRQGALWLAVDANVYRLQNGEFTVFSAGNGMPGSFVTAIAQDASGDLWFGTVKDGACRLAENRIVCYDPASGLSSNHVVNFLLDRENTLWITTYEAGIDRVATQIITPLSVGQGLPDKNVYPIFEDRAGDVWIGSFKGLTKYSKGKITNFTSGENLLYEIVLTIFEDRSGKIWVGNVGGVQLLENNRAVDFTAQLGLKIGEIEFNDIHQTLDGAMWFATSVGLYKYENGAVTRFTTENGLPGDNVNQILEARDGSLWIGTTGGAAQLKANRFAAFAEKDDLAGNYVRSIYEDADNLLWFGTYDSGLWLLRDGKFTNFNVGNGLFSNGAFQILPDARGNFWMSSNQGIYRVNRQQLIDFADGKISSIVSTAFGKSDGMLSTECNGGRQPAGIRASDGRLWFPTQDGVAIVDPEAVRFNPLAPPVVIENVVVDNKTVDDFQPAIVIEPEQDNLEINYTGLSFVKPEQIRFRYKMEGLDDVWTEAGGRRTAFYTYLPPGEYTFRVAAANSDDVWNEPGASIKITVKPPFYRTWWFILSAAIGVAAAAYFAYRRRVSQLEKKNEQQQMFSGQMIQSQERERKRIAIELHDSLGQQLLVIKNWAMLEIAARGENNLSREALNEISGTASDAIEEVREIIYDLRPYQLDKIGLTKTIAYMIEKVAAASDIKFKTEIDPIDDLFDYEQEVTLYRIVQECLNNIVKHSGATIAIVSIKTDGQTVKLIVEDNGRGFNREISDEELKPKGFGLTGIGERVRMLGGTNTIVSAPDGGTKIAVSIPLVKNK